MKRCRWLIGTALLCQLGAQTPVLDLRTVRPKDRITGAVDDGLTVMRAGNHHPLALAENELGPAAPDHRMERMVLVLSPDPVQQHALESLLAAQQDPQSPHYHQWLTPESFGKLFGVSEHDLEQLTGWLAHHGFDVEPVSSARRSILFSGTAAQVDTAFHAEVHAYKVNGERHYANSTDPKIPAAFAEVVEGVASLHDFRSTPMLQGLEVAQPEYSAGSTHYLAPADFATIYDVAGLYNSSIDGTGQSIAIVGRSNFNAADASNFRSIFGLPANNPGIVLNGPDPGIVSGGEQNEAELDVQWAGAVAKNAAIQFVLSGSTSATDGVLLSAQYIVNHNLAPVMSMSFGLCEAAMGTTQNQFWNGLWQQAAAQGISVFVSSGDSGAAGCDSPSQSKAVMGRAVNGLCSSPSSTCVGGTQFVDAANPSQYWSTTTDPHTYGSALGYIPEAAWNASAAAGGSGLWASGGGASSIYPKPAWQTGAGVPADGHRDVPDVSLNASVHDGYLFCLNGQLYVVGGTSAAAPSFAGLMAMLVQRAGARQGNANPTFYGLASNQANGGAAVFHDVTSGNNSVPGVAGFSAGTGYDLATGLGSVDALMLVNHWSDSALPAAPNFQLSAPASSLNLTQGASSTLQVNVSIRGGFNSAIALSLSASPGLTASFSPAGLAAPGSGSSTVTLSAAPTAPPGNYSLVIVAAGGGITQIWPLAVTVQPSCSYAINPTSTAPSAAGGNFSATVAAPGGCAWNASSGFNWITIASGASGSGNGAVLYSVAPNSSTAARTGSIFIAGLALTVAQAAAAPTSPPLNPASATFAAAGGRGSITVNLPQTNQFWTASSNSRWITITSGGSSYGGNKTISYSVAANTSSSSRTGTITIAGLAFTVTQAGTSCAYSITLGKVTPAAGGFNGTVSVSTAAACPWSAVSNTSWITVTSGTFGSGPGTVGFFVANNPTSASRSGTMSVAGYTIQVNEGPTSVH